MVIVSVHVARTGLQPPQSTTCLWVVRVRGHIYVQNPHLTVVFSDLGCGWAKERRGGVHEGYADSDPDPNAP